MAVSIAFANQKGGVGKTTLSTQFAFYLSKTLKKKVLFLDMDAQGNSSETILGSGVEVTGTKTEDLFENLPDKAEDINWDKETPKVQKGRYGIDLIASVSGPRAYDVDSLPMKQIICPMRRISRIVDQYDFVIIDCPPTLSRRLTSALVMAEFVICPVILGGYVVSSLKNLFTTIKGIKQLKARMGLPLNILGIAANQYQQNAVQRTAQEAINKALPGMMFETVIRYRSPVSLACGGEAIEEVRHGQVAAKEMNQLFDEILERIQKK